VGEVEVTAAKPKALPDETYVDLVRTGDGYEAVWPVHTYRFLLDDGRVIDVESHQDDSRLRGALLLVTKAAKIEGVTKLP
jgi:hypothetical protein